MRAVQKSVLWNRPAPGGMQAPGNTPFTPPRANRTMPIAPRRAAKMERKAAKGTLPNMDK